MPRSQTVVITLCFALLLLGSKVAGATPSSPPVGSDWRASFVTQPARPSPPSTSRCAPAARMRRFGRSRMQTGASSSWHLPPGRCVLAARAAGFEPGRRDVVVFASGTASVDGPRSRDRARAGRGRRVRARPHAPSRRRDRPTGAEAAGAGTGRCRLSEDRPGVLGDPKGRDRWRPRAARHGRLAPGCLARRREHPRRVRQPHGPTDRVRLPGRLRARHRREGPADRHARSGELGWRRALRENAHQLRHARSVGLWGVDPGLIRAQRCRGRGEGREPCRERHAVRDAFGDGELPGWNRPGRALDVSALEHERGLSHGPLVASTVLELSGALSDGRGGICRPHDGRRQVRPREPRAPLPAAGPLTSGRIAGGAGLLQLRGPRHGQLQPAPLHGVHDDGQPGRVQSRPPHDRRPRHRVAVPHDPDDGGARGGRPIEPPQRSQLDEPADRPLRGEGPHVRRVVRQCRRVRRGHPAPRVVLAGRRRRQSRLVVCGGSPEDHFGRHGQHGLRLGEPYGRADPHGRARERVRALRTRGRRRDGVRRGRSRTTFPRLLGAVQQGERLVAECVRHQAGTYDATRRRREIPSRRRIRLSLAVREHASTTTS